MPMPAPRAPPVRAPFWPLDIVSVQPATRLAASNTIAMDILVMLSPLCGRPRLQRGRRSKERRRRVHRGVQRSDQIASQSSTTMGRSRRSARRNLDVTGKPAAPPPWQYRRNRPDKSQLNDRAHQGNRLRPASLPPEHAPRVGAHPRAPRLFLSSSGRCSRMSASSVRARQVANQRFTCRGSNQTTAGSSRAGSTSSGRSVRTTTFCG
jgi:hypothetical protein